MQLPPPSLVIRSNNTTPSLFRKSYQAGIHQLVKWTNRLSNDTFVEVHVRGHKPLQVQSALLTANINPSSSRIKISWPREPPLQPQFLAAPILDLKEFPLGATYIFMRWLYNRRVALLQSNYRKICCDTQELIDAIRRTGKALPSDTMVFNFLMTESYLLGAALDSPVFQNEVLFAVARALEKEEIDAVRGPTPHTSSAIAWARWTWDKASKREEGKKLAEFAVDVAARRVFTTGQNGGVLTQEERKNLSGAGFAGEVFASVGAQIGMKGVRLGELARTGRVEMMREAEFE